MIEQWIDIPVGQLRAVWTDTGLLHSCSFNSATSQASLNEMLSTELKPQAAQVEPSKLLNRQQMLSETFEDYFDQGHLQWNLELLDWANIGPFHQRVLRACYQIPASQTITYGQLAEQVGHPRAARAVGTAMARNRWPILIPCHRVVGSSGRLTGYSGTGGLATKRWLLDLESETSQPQVSVGVGQLAAAWSQV